MTVGRAKPYPGKKLAANAVVFASVTLLGVPALASTISDNAYPKSEQATFSVADIQLNVNNVSHDVTLVPTTNSDSSRSAEANSKTSFWAPRAEAAIREAFSDRESPSAKAVDVELIKTVLRAPMAGIDSESDTAVATDGSVEPLPEMKTQLPGVSDSELSHFKKQMFRRDI